MVNVLSLTSGSMKNFIGTLTTATTGAQLAATTSATVVIKISSLMLANGTTGLLSTATLTLVSGGVTHTVAAGVDVDPSQPPVQVITRAAPLYLTGTQSLRGFASSTHVSAIIAYEEFS